MEAAKLAVKPKVKVDKLQVLDLTSKETKRKHAYNWRIFWDENILTEEF
jgi:hypothetical protein